MKKMSAAIKASDLIKQAQADDFIMPCDEAIAELKKVLAYNDAAGGRQTHMRISAEKACKMLDTWGYPCCRGKIQIVCQRLGRKSYAYAQ